MTVTVPPIPGPKLMKAYLSGTPERSRDTGERKYFTKPIIERIQRMGSTGRSEFNLDELVTFNPRFDSPPYPYSDMLIVERPGSPLPSGVIPDLGFSVGGRTYSCPIIFGEYSRGATSREVHIAVGKVALKKNIIFGVGEGGVIDSLRDNPNVMVQVATGLSGVKLEMLQNACIISIKMSQIAKTGMGGHLPKNKVDKEIQEMRGMPAGVDILSDASRIYSIEEMRALSHVLHYVTEIVQKLKTFTDKPVFIKVGATNHIAHVAAGAARGNANGIIIDGLGGGTAAAPIILRDHIGMSIELAIRLAHKEIESIGMRDNFKIIAAGRVDLPSKIFKLMLLGADGVLMGTASLTALGCKVVNLCHRDCPTALTAIPKVDGVAKRLLDVDWASHVLENFLSASMGELSEILATFGFRTPLEARGRVDLLHSQMPSSLSKMLDVPTTGAVFPVPIQYPQPYLSKSLETLAETGRPIISSMGRTTDLNPPYSHFDLLVNDGRTVIGPAFDSHREIIETLTHMPGTMIGFPLILADNGQESSRLARECNTLVLSPKGTTDPRRHIVPISMDKLEAQMYAIREAGGVLLDRSDATSANIEKIAKYSTTPVYVSIAASENVREDVVALARAGVAGIIIDGSLSMLDPCPIDVAISQVHDSLSLAIHEGKILRRKTAIIAKTQIRSAHDIYLLNCLGADAVVSDVDALISTTTYQSKINLIHGLEAELKILMGASGLSMMSSVIGNRGILRADHSLDKKITDLLGVDYIGV